MDLDADVEKTGYGLYYCCAAVAITTMAVLIIHGYGLYCFYVAVAITITNLAIIAAAKM